jgi:hypothetical protein
MPVGPGQRDAERRSTSVHDEVALRARLATVRGVRPRRRPPFLAAMLMLSSEARLQSNCPARSICSSSARCRADQIPACCHSCSRRQQDMPEPHPISAGRYSHGSPVLSTNRMPVSAARSGIGGRPPLGRGRAGGNRGEMCDQRSSESRGLAMPRRSAWTRPVSSSVKRS